MANTGIKRSVSHCGMTTSYPEMVDQATLCCILVIRLWCLNCVIGADCMQVAGSWPVRSADPIGDQYNNWIGFARPCGDALYTGCQPYSAIRLKRLLCPETIHSSRNTAVGPCHDVVGRP